MILPAEIRRTYSEVIRKDEDFLAVVLALCLQAKNLGNATLWVIRNILTAHGADDVPKTVLNDQQIKAREEVNAAVRLLNADHAAKNAKRLTEDPEAKLLKIYKEFGGADPDQRANRWDILDPFLLDKVMRAHRDQDGFLVYRALPGVVAQQTIREVVEAFDGYRAAVALWRQEPERFTGRPQWPDYRGRNERAPATFTAQSLKKKDGHYQFLSVANKTLHVDYAKSAALTDKVKVGFANYRLDETLRDLHDRVKPPEGARLCEVRLVPQPGGRAKLEAVYAWPMELPPGCFAARTYAELEKQFPKLKPSQVNDALIRLLGEIPEQELPRIAGIDPGLKNFLAMAYSTGDRGMVLSNRNIEGPLERFDRRYDQLKSELTSPALSYLLVRNMKKRDLSGAEVIEMKKMLRELHADERILAVLRDRENCEQDMLHKISAGVVDFLVKRGIEVLVIGLNLFWKQNCWMGRQMDRRFLRSAHTRLIELLKYKCLAAGILVVTTEEAYTSQRSFALGEPIPAWQPEKEENHDVTEAKGGTEKAGGKPARHPHVRGGPTIGGQPPVVPDVGGMPRGYRGRDKHRNFYFSPGAPEGWRVLHADLNGGYNIIRKVFKSFRCHAGLTPKFLLFRFDRKANLTRLRCRKAA